MNSLEEKLERYDPETFYSDVVKLVAEDELSYLEAVLELTNNGDIEDKFISKLISPKLKDILRYEALAINYLNKEEFGDKTFDLLSMF
jgi:hypothetical protein